jgi:hypothetical protein
MRRKYGKLENRKPSLYREGPGCEKVRAAFK